MPACADGTCHSRDDRLAASLLMPCGMQDAACPTYTGISTPTAHGLSAAAHQGRRHRQPVCWLRLAELRQALALNTPGGAAGTHYLTRRLALPAGVKKLLRKGAGAALRHEPRHLSPSDKGSQHCSFHTLSAKGMQWGYHCAAKCRCSEAEVARHNMTLPDAHKPVATCRFTQRG